MRRTSPAMVRFGSGASATPPASTAGASSRKSIWRGVPLVARFGLAQVLLKWNELKYCLLVYDAPSEIMSFGRYTAPTWNPAPNAPDDDEAPEYQAPDPSTAGAAIGIGETASDAQ